MPSVIMSLRKTALYHWLKDTSTEDDDSNYTIVLYRHLTIKIEAKIMISTNLISLSIYEV